MKYNDKFILVAHLNVTNVFKTCKIPNKYINKNIRRGDNRHGNSRGKNRDKSNNHSEWRKNIELLSKI